MSKQNEYAKGLLVGALLGGAVGAITALLFAPKPGVELRKDIADKSAELYDKATDCLHNAESNISSTVANTYNEGKVKAQRIVETARTQAEGILNNAEEILKDARSKATSMKTNVTDKIQNVRDAAKAGAEVFKAELNNNNEA